MKKLLFALLLISCGTLQPELSTNTIYNKIYSIEQLDSIMKSEHISHFDSIPLKSSNGGMYEYYYLKDSLVIRAIKDGDNIKVTKRINK